jgi:hypothetical protein
METWGKSDHDTLQPKRVHAFGVLDSFVPEMRDQFGWVPLPVLRGKSTSSGLATSRFAAFIYICRFKNPEKIPLDKQLSIR